MEFGDRRLPVWITELSWPATRRTHRSDGFETNNTGQAKRLRRTLRLLAAERRSMRIRRVYWYTWLSVEGITSSAFDYSGLRRVRNGALFDTPALTVFTRMARELQGCAKVMGDAVNNCPIL